MCRIAALFHLMTMSWTKQPIGTTQRSTHEVPP